MTIADSARGDHMRLWSPCFCESVRRLRPNRKSRRGNSVDPVPTRSHLVKRAAPPRRSSRFHAPACAQAKADDVLPLPMPPGAAALDLSCSGTPRSASSLRDRNRRRALRTSRTGTPSRRRSSTWRRLAAAKGRGVTRDSTSNARRATRPALERGQEWRVPERAVGSSARRKRVTSSVRIFEVASSASCSRRWSKCWRPTGKPTLQAGAEGQACRASSEVRGPHFGRRRPQGIHLRGHRLAPRTFRLPSIAVEPACTACASRSVSGPRWKRSSVRREDFGTIYARQRRRAAWPLSLASELHGQSPASVDVREGSGEAGGLYPGPARASSRWGLIFQGSTARADQPAERTTGPTAGISRPTSRI